MFFNSRCFCCQTIIPLLAGFLVNFPVGSLAVAVAVLDLLASGALEKFAGLSALATDIRRRLEFVSDGRGRIRHGLSPNGSRSKSSGLQDVVKHFMC